MRERSWWQKDHHLIERGFHRKHEHVGAGDHDLADLQLAKFDGAENKLFFTDGQQSPFTCLLDLNLQFFGGVRLAVADRSGQAQRFHDDAGNAIEQINRPAEGIQEPLKRARNHQSHRSARTRLMVLGTSSPKTTCRTLSMRKAILNAKPWITRMVFRCHAWA